MVPHGAKRSFHFERERHPRRTLWTLPCGGEVERGLSVRERAHDTRAPPDLAQVVGANPPPVLLPEGVVGECFLDRRFH